MERITRRQTSTTTKVMDHVEKLRDDNQELIANIAIGKSEYINK